MSEPRAVLFSAYVEAVALLRRRFGDGDGPVGTESLGTFLVERTVDAGWLAAHLGDLGSELLPLRFRVVVAGRVHGHEMRLRLHETRSGIEASTERWAETALPSGATLSDAGADAYRAFRERLGATGRSMPLDGALALIGRLSDEGVGLDLAAKVSLDDKTVVARRFAAGGDPERLPTPIVFLFPETVAAALATHSLGELEAKCFLPGRRAVFLVFGMEGGFGNDLVAFTGQGWAGRLDELLTRPLPDAVLEESRKVLDLHRAGGVWLERCRWLRPELFELQGTPERPAAGVAAILGELRLLRVLLAAVFLSDHAEAVAEDEAVEDGAEQRVKFRGRVEVQIGVGRKALAAIDGEPELWTDRQETDRIDDLYRLYQYAYKGFSVDKLKIAQEFVALLVRDLATLGTKASEVEGATRKTYQRSLTKRVEEYFQARQKIQDRLEAAVSEVAGGMLGLTREVSGDLYKVAGLSIGALVGAFLKPNLTPVALLTAGAGVAIYAFLVIALHLPTVERTAALRLEQHRSYIRSFEDVLEEVELQRFLDDPHLRDVDVLLTRKAGWARLVYLAALMVALLVALGAGIEIHAS